MSAAEPARHGPDHAREGTVLSFPASRPRRPRSERTTVPPQPDQPLTPEQRVAATLEAAYVKHRRSLTDESTALDFLIALSEFRTVVRGALETGLLTKDQFQSLDGMLEAMEAAPGVLSA